MNVTPDGAYNPSKPRKPRVARQSRRAPDPFAPTTPQQIEQMIGKYTSGYGQPMTDQQITDRARGEIDPILTSMTGAINQRANTSAAQIGANSQALAKQLAGVDYAAPYQGAIHDQAAVDAALHQALSGGGGQLAGDLSSRLGSIQEPGAVQGAAGAVAAQGQGAANASLASGSASLSQLLANKAGAQEYGAKQPGIAQLSGLQGIAGVQRDAQQQIADKTSELLGNLPQIIGSLRSENQATQGNRADMAANLFQFLSGQNLSKAGARVSQHNTQVAQKAAQHNTAVAQKTAAANTRFQHEIAANTGLISLSKAQASIDQGRARVNQGQQRVNVAKQSTAERARHDKATETAREKALNQTAKRLGISRAQLDARTNAQKETTRHHKAGEQDARARANLARRKQALAEKKKNKGGSGAAPWATG